MLPCSPAALPTGNLVLIFTAINISVEIGIPIDVDIDIATVPV